MIKFHKKLSILIGVFLLTLCGGHLSLRAQEATATYGLDMDDFSNLSLPPLDVLFENAKNAPTYELAQIQEELERRMLKKEKRAFLSFFSVRGSWQYGTFANDGYMSSLIQEPVYSYTESDQTLYSVGASINIPFETLFDLVPRVKRQKLKVRAAELQKEIQFQNLKQEIINLYLTAQAQVEIVKSRAQALILANTQYAIVQNEFANGHTDSGVLATEKEKQSVALERYSSSKSQLTKSIMMLEIITNTPITRK